MENSEKVQRRATKMIQGYKDFSYEERLKRSGLSTLKNRRSRGDLIEAILDYYWKGINTVGEVL